MRHIVQYLRHLLQAFVACQMAILIIDPLQPVHIAQKKRSCMFRVDDRSDPFFRNIFLQNAGKTVQILPSCLFLYLLPVHNLHTPPILYTAAPSCLYHPADHIELRLIGDVKPVLPTRHDIRCIHTELL